LLTPEFLKETWGQMNRRAAAGIDGESCEQFESELEQRVQEINQQLRAGTYRAPSVRRVEIPKGPGKVGTRPLGMRKFKRFVGHKVRASQFLIKIAGDHAHLFVHWRLGMTGTFI
jgi:hypothetical protein